MVNTISSVVHYVLHICSGYKLHEEPAHFERLNHFIPISSALLGEEARVVSLPPFVSWVILSTSLSAR